MAKKLTKAQVAEQRATWARQAQAERDRIKADPEYRLTWLARPAIKASFKPATWRAKRQAALAAVRGRKARAKGAAA